MSGKEEKEPVSCACEYVGVPGGEGGKGPGVVHVLHVNVLCTAAWECLVARQATVPPPKCQLWSHH